MNGSKPYSPAGIGRTPRREHPRCAVPWFLSPHPWGESEPFSLRRTIQTRRLSSARCALLPAHEPEFEARLFLSLPVRHERGESRREGLSKKKFLLSPTLSSLLRREEREKRPDLPRFRGPRRAQSPGRSHSEGGQGEVKRRELPSRVSDHSRNCRTGRVLRQTRGFPKMNNENQSGENHHARFQRQRGH